MGGSASVAMGETTRSAESGTALIIALLVAVILTLLGIPFLLMGETENRIAENERLSLQAFYAAEAGAKMVKRWFDHPQHASNAVNPVLAAVDRSQRLIDADGDPATAPVVADGSIDRPYYKQADDRIFEKPYRDDLVDTLLGTESGPDVRIDRETSAAARNFLDDLSEVLLGGYPGPGRLARISRIDAYAPPYVADGGGWRRFGIATIKVVAGIYQDAPDGERLLAERSVRVVLNEVPYTTGVFGPLVSCGDLAWNGPLTVHWGLVLVDGDADLPDDHWMRPVGLPRVVPDSATNDLLWAHDDDARWSEYYETWVLDRQMQIQDPWFRLVARGSIAGAPNGSQQPWPFLWANENPLVDGQLTYHPGEDDDSDDDDGDFTGLDGTHSNYFQNMSGVRCPPLDYETWKALALAGGPNVHYYTWASGDEFREDGEGDPVSFQDITNDSVGFYFFDTTDGMPPGPDADSDGYPDNLTPTITVAGGGWGFRGIVYLNARVFHAHDTSPGNNVPFQLPAEPFQDRNGNGRWDPADPVDPTSTDEGWVNLEFNQVLQGDADKEDDFGAAVGSIAWNARGGVEPEPANFWGLLINNGYFDSTGNGIYYGAVVARLGVGEFTAVMDTPDIYWDQSIVEDFPPEAWQLPRVRVTRWETD